MKKFLIKCCAKVKHALWRREKRKRKDSRKRILRLMKAIKRIDRVSDEEVSEQNKRKLSTSRHSCKEEMCLDRADYTVYKKKNFFL